MNSNMNNNNGGGRKREYGPAKIRGNKIHVLLKTLCLQWMKKHTPLVVEQLRTKARRKVKEDKHANG